MDFQPVKLHKAVWYTKKYFDGLKKQQVCNFKSWQKKWFNRRGRTVLKRLYWLYGPNEPFVINSSSKGFWLGRRPKSANPNWFNTETGPGVKWYRNFELGHKLTNRKVDNVDRGRSRIGNVTVWKQHFNLLEETIDKLELRDNPKAIFNCDKSIIAMDKRSGTVVSKKTKYTYPESKGTWDHITINACVLVWSMISGFIMPPHIILYPSGSNVRDGPDGALYSISDNGYMNSELFYGFIYKLFILHTIYIPGPKLLIYDRNGSHLNTDIINLCWENNIQLPLLTTPHHPYFSAIWCRLRHERRAIARSCLCTHLKR